MVVTDCLYIGVLSSRRCSKKENRQKQGCFTDYLSAEVADVARCLVDAALQSSAGIVPPFVLSDVASSRCGSTCDHDRPQAVIRDAASFLELGSVGLRQNASEIGALHLYLPIEVSWLRMEVAAVVAISLVVELSRSVLAASSSVWLSTCVFL